MTGLSAYTVTAVETATVRSVYPRPVGRNSFRGAHGSGAEEQVVVLRTDHGASGWGLPLAGPLDPAGVLGRSLAELVDPDRGVLDPAALPFDYALHDLAGRVLDLPVHALLGGAGPRQSPCYSGALYFDDLDPEDAPRGTAAVADNLAADADAGYRAFKLKLGRGHRWMGHAEGLQRDIEVTRLARALQPDADLLVDMNDGYSLDTLAVYLDAVADVGLFWVEEPFAERYEDFLALRELLSASGSATLVADGEYAPQLATILSLGDQGLIDVALMDVVGFGLTAWRQVMPQLVARGVRASPHAWGSPLKTLYAAQIAAGLGNVVTVEGVPGRTEGADTSGYRLVDGRLAVPDTPGFGIDLVG